MTDLELGACPSCLRAGQTCSGAHLENLTVVAPDTELEEFAKTVILSAAEDEPEPAYIVTGWTWCIRCARQVWLGDGTGPQVLAGAVGLCLRCAVEMSALLEGKRTGRIDDTLVEQVDRS